MSDAASNSQPTEEAVAAGERRGRFRFDIADLEATLGGKPVKITDLSLTGIGLLVVAPLVPGGRHELRLLTELRDLVASASVVWCQPLSATGESSERFGYRAGLRFLPLATEDADLLSRMLRWQSQRSQRQPERPEEESTSKFSAEDIAEIVQRADATRKPES